MKTLVIISLVLLSALAVPQLKEKIQSHPEPWYLHSTSTEDESLNLLIFIRQQNLDILEKKLYAVSDPESPWYGMHLNNEQITQIVQPESKALEEVLKWLNENGIYEYELNANNDILQTSITVQKAEEMLNTKYQVYKHDSLNMTVTRCLDYSIPTEVHQYIDFIGPTVRFPLDTTPKIEYAQFNAPDAVGMDPSILRKLYKVGDYKASNSSTTLALCGFLNQYIGPNDLQEFFRLYDGQSSGRKANIVGPNHPLEVGIEADLDIQYGMSMGAGVEDVTFWSTPGKQPYNPENEPFLVWLYNVSNTTNAPQIFSISYGDNEDTVNFEYAERVNAEFMKAGARGISIMASSGDGGVSGGQPQSCKTFVPTYPAASPYVTAVGGTNTGTETQKAAGLSSGGFSNYWDAPDYQKSAIEGYKNSGTKLPDADRYNQTGAGFPDVAAGAENYGIVYRLIPMPVSGTSCASPAFSGMVSLLNDQRLNAGKPVLGWLNPLIYQHPEIFQDITAGNNPGCGTDGFEAAPGWDPVTGMGTMDFEKFSALIGELNKKVNCEFPGSCDYDKKEKKKAEWKGMKKGEWKKYKEMK